MAAKAPESNNSAQTTRCSSACSDSTVGKSRTQASRSSTCSGGGSRSVTPRVDEIDRCSCCSIKVFWVAYDVFHVMDRRGAGAVQRKDFTWALRSQGAFLDFQRILRKAGLQLYFRGTAQELYLVDFLYRVFPCLIPADLECMLGWVNLRRAWHFVQALEFRASKDELQDLFGLMSGGGHARVPIAFLHQARIFTEVETRAVLEDADARSTLSLEEFVVMFQPALAKKYGIPDSEPVDGLCVGLHDRLLQSLGGAPTPDELADVEDVAPSPRSHTQARPQGLPRLPRRPCGRGAYPAGCAAMSILRMQRASLTAASCRPAL